MYTPDCQEDEDDLKKFKETRRELELLVMEKAKALAHLISEIEWLDTTETLRRKEYDSD
tara:strand:- start:399 stop:575 length:177 start_codon:yes stop_codon:yes gene_type:complete